VTGAKEFVVGGVGMGNATHLTALALGEKHRFDVRYILFKSNNDALVNMAGNNGVEFVIDKYESYQALKTKNPSMRMIAASCPSRLPQEPGIKTLREQGISAPYVFNITVAHRLMPRARRIAVADILNTATKNIGAREIFELSATRPPVFDGISVEEFYLDSIQLVEKLQNKYQTKINSGY
jgi:tripartite-type tricarboxylate transporter receptor subunit TctC